MGGVWAKLADYHDALTARIEEHRRTLRVLAGRPPQPQQMATLELALAESVIFQPELATDRARLEAVAGALAKEAEQMLRDAKHGRRLSEIDELLVMLERVTNTRVKAAWTSLRAYRDDVAETVEKLRTLIEKTVGSGDDARVMAVLRESEPYAAELGQSWQVLKQYSESMRQEATRELRGLLQLRPGEHDADDGESGVIAMIDSALAVRTRSPFLESCVGLNLFCLAAAVSALHGPGTAGALVRALRPSRGHPSLRQLRQPPACGTRSVAERRAGRGVGGSTAGGGAPHCVAAAAAVAGGRAEREHAAPRAPAGSAGRRGTE